MVRLHAVVLAQVLGGVGCTNGGGSGEVGGVGVAALGNLFEAGAAIVLAREGEGDVIL